MSKSSIDIDRVVREVLAELDAARPAPPSAQRPQTAVAGGSDASPPRAQSRDVGDTGAPTDGELTIAARLVSTAELQGRLDSVRRVVVPRGAVVTPAARDELLRRGIALESAEAPADDKPAVRLMMVVAQCDYDPSPLAAALGREGIRVDRRRSDCLIAAVDKLAEEVSRSEAIGVLLTQRAAAGLCLANRLPGVRAISAGDAAAAAAEVGANLLVADPRAGSFFQLKRLVAEFARGGARPCPAVFHERLS